MGPLADYFGRRKVILYECIAVCISMCLVLSSPNFNWLIIYWFIYEVFNQVYGTILVYSSEILSQRLHGMLVSVVCVSFSFSGMLDTFLFYFLGNWIYIHWIIIFFAFCGTFLFFKIGIESPTWAIEKKKLSSFSKDMLYVAKVNDTLPYVEQDIKEFMLMLESSHDSELILSHGDFDISKNETNISFWKNFIKDSRFRIYTISIAYSHLVVCGIYYGVQIKLDSYDPNIFLFSSVFYISEVVGELLSGYMADLLGRVKTMKICFGLTIVSTIGLILLQNYLIFKVVFFGIFSFSISMCYATVLIYIPELFEVAIRSTANNVVKIPGDIFTMFFPHIVEWIPNPFLLFLSLTIVAFLTISLCKETKIFKNTLL